MKWHYFTVIETGNPAAACFLMAGIDEDLFVETLSGFMDYKVKPTPSENYLFAMAIIRRKAIQLVEARIGAFRPFQLTEFGEGETKKSDGDPVFSKGGLSIWISQ